jgi:ABC-2 type transport system permease protein
MVAYRAEMLVWVSATTMPLIMLALWSAVAHDAPVGRFDQQDFRRLLPRHVHRPAAHRAWVAWQLSFEVRTGHAGDAASSARSTPWSRTRWRTSRPSRSGYRGAFRSRSWHSSSPGRAGCRATRSLWIILLLSLLGGWLITFLANAGIGTLASGPAAA